jgi:hypothetical protein
VGSMLWLGLGLFSCGYRPGTPVKPNRAGATRRLLSDALRHKHQKHQKNIAYGSSLKQPDSSSPKSPPPVPSPIGCHLEASEIIPSYPSFCCVVADVVHPLPKYWHVLKPFTLPISFVYSVSPDVIPELSRTVHQITGYCELN